MRIRASKLLSDDLMKLIKNPFMGSVLYLYLRGIVFLRVGENQWSSCNMGKLVIVIQLGSETRLPANSLVSMCLNNHVDMAVENNWSAFVEGAVEINYLSRNLYLVQDPVSNSNTFSRKCVHIIDRWALDLTILIYNT